MTGFDDSHRTNYRYLSWKWGLSDFDSSVSLRYLSVDVKFKKFLNGKSKKEIAKWFPNLRSPKNSDKYQQFYLNEMIDRDFFWIGNSNWVVEFEESKVVSIHTVKG